MNYWFELVTLYLWVRRWMKGEQSIKFFTSDWHFCHKNVIEYCDRPWKDVQQMNNALVRRWNAMVREQDEVYMLGDFAMNDNRARDYGAKLRGTKYLVPGNHDHCFWSTKRIDRYTDGGFVVLSKHITRWVGRYYVQLAHMPYGDELAKQYDTRYFEHRPTKGNEDALLHGHQHCKYVKNKDRIDVGIDHNFRLYSEEDVVKLIEDKRSFIKSRLDGQVSRHGEAM